MRRTSFVRHALTKSAAPGPVTEALPRWLTSKTPTRSRTAVCSATTPPPGYSIGMSQPPKSAILAPRATWRSCRGEWRAEVVPDGAVVMVANLPFLRARDGPVTIERARLSCCCDVPVGAAPADGAAARAPTPPRRHVREGALRDHPDSLLPLGGRCRGRRPRRRPRLRRQGRGTRAG